MKELELYRVLGVSPTATKAELKGAFRTLAKRYHPDAAGAEGCNQMFANVVNAYQILMGRCHQGKGADKNTGGSPWDIFQLGKMLISGKEPSLRAFAAAGLGNSGKISAYGYLRRALQDKSSIVLRSVVKAIGNLKIYQSAGELGALFIHADREVKQEILNTVDRLSSPQTFNNILLIAMKDDCTTIRKRALHLFARQKR